MSTNIENLRVLSEKLQKDIEQRRTEALNTAAQYIKTEEKRKAFLNRQNYSMGITNEYLEYSMKILQVKILQVVENHTEKEIEPPQPKPIERNPPSIKSIHFFNGKEAARAASIARAKAKYDF